MAANNNGAYDDLDMSTIQMQTQELMRDLGARDATDVQAKLATIADQERYQQIASQTQSTMNARVTDDMIFQRNTHLLAQLNESWNANRYIANSLTADEKRVARLDTLTKRDIYKSRQGRMYTTYMVNYYGFATSMAIATFFVVLLLLVPVAMWQVGKLSFHAMLIAAGVILALYLVLAWLLMRKTARRRTSDWRQYYWKLGSVKKDNRDNDENCPMEPTMTAATVVGA